MIVYHTLLCVYRIRKTREPEYLASILCRDSLHGSGRIIVENIKLELQRDSFTYRGAMHWNKLPPDLRLEPKLNKFKSGLKEWIAENVERFPP